MSDNDEKFANVPEDELRKYVEDSVQRPGESDTDWARRNELAELKLLAQYADSGPADRTPAPDAVKDAPEAAQEVTEADPQ